MAKQRCKLSKKLFFTLKPGQFIMDNYLPSHYERIDDDLESLWQKWRKVNGNVVNIYDSKEECLRDWWRSNSAEVVKSEKEKRVLYYGKLTRDVFFNYPDGHYLLFTQSPFDFYELSAEREKLWETVKARAGLQIRIFENHALCAIYINEMIENMG
jgi:hypothetical protein